MATVKLPMASGTRPMASGTPHFSVFRTVLALVLLTVLGWSFGVATVWAQKAGDAKALTKAEFMAILRGKAIGNQADFESYVTKEITSPFGVSGPPADRLYKLRYQLKIYLNTARSGQAHDELNRMTLAKMVAIIRDGKAPDATKINAVIVMGELNDVDEPGKSKPLLDAFSWLWVITHSPKAKDELKVAAMLGIDRFAAAGTIPAAKKDEVAKSMLALVKQKDPPPKLSPDGHNWMRH